MSNTRILRDRQAEARSTLDRMGTQIEEGGLSVLIKTITVATYPGTPSAFFACQPLSIDGTEREGAIATLTVDASRTFYAYNLGTQVPPPGTRLIVTGCNGRWVFRYDG